MGQIATRHGSRTDAGILAAIYNGYRDGLTASQIQRKLLQDKGIAAPIPVRRTIERIVRHFRETEAAETAVPWRLVEADPQEIPIVLPCLHALLSDPMSRPARHLSKREAAVIVRITAAAPDLSAEKRLSIAGQYLMREAYETSTDTLDELLAFAPWRGEHEFEAYVRVAFRRHHDAVTMYEIFDSAVNSAIFMEADRTGESDSEVVVRAGRIYASVSRASLQQDRS